MDMYQTSVYHLLHRFFKRLSGERFVVVKHAEMFEHFHGGGPCRIGIGVAGKLASIELGGAMENSQENGVFFARGLLGGLGKLRWKKDMVDEEV
jgi:hypothetical protein